MGRDLGGVASFGRCHRQRWLNRGPLTRPLHSSSLRTAWNNIVISIEDWNLARRSNNIVFLIVAGVLAGATITFVLTVGVSEDPARDLNPLGDEHEAGPVEQGRQGPIEYVNHAQGYGFSYPGTWDLRETEGLTRVRSPSGVITVSFRLGAAGDLEFASSRLLKSFTDLSDLELIGMRHERIGGSRSLLVSGTATDESGRPVRFLAITIRGQPRSYAISVVVPRGSEPARVLPRIEEIVSSFEVHGVSARTDI